MQEALAVHNTQPGHELSTMVLTWSDQMGIRWGPHHIFFFAVRLLLQNEPFLVVPKDMIKPLVIVGEPELTGLQSRLLVLDG